MKKKLYQVPALEVVETTVTLPLALSITKDSEGDYADEDDVLSKKSQRDNARRDDYTDNGWTDGLW